MSTPILGAFIRLWILPWPKKHATGIFLPLLRRGRPLRIPLLAKKRDTQRVSLVLAEQQGFEPWRHFHVLRDFESRLFDQLEYCSIFRTGLLYQPEGRKSSSFRQMLQEIQNSTLSGMFIAQIGNNGRQCCSCK